MSSYTSLTQKSIPSLLWTYARPSMFASLITGLYGIVDGIFVGQKMGPPGLAAITLAFPIISFLIAIGCLFSIGTSIVVNHSLAGRNKHEAKRYIVVGLKMLLIAGLLTTLASFFTSEIMAFLGKGTDGYVVDLSQSFVSVILAGSLIYMAPIFFNDLLKNLGHPKLAMMGMILGTVVNIILDYIFIFILDLELVGAAVATLSGQFIAFLFIYFFIRKNHVFKLKLEKAGKNLSMAFKIIKTGCPSFVIQISTMALLLIHNRLFLHYGNELYVSAFGIIGYALSAYWLISNGFVGGTQPILSHNYIKNLNSRVRKTLKLTFIFVISFSLVYSLLFYIFPDQIIAIFSKHDIQLYNITKLGFKLVMYALPFAGINVISAMYFQSIGKNKTSIFLAVSRVVFFMIPLILILPKTLGVNGIFLIIPLSEVFTSVLSITFIYKNLTKDNSYFTVNHNVET